MHELIKEKQVNWELLMQVLSGEKPDNHPDFIAWLEESEENRTLYAELSNDKIKRFNTRKMYKKVKREITGQSPKRSFSPIYRYAVAASVVLILSFTIYWGLGTKGSETLIAQEEALEEKAIEPGGKKAVLVLEDGSSVELKEIFTMIQNEGTVIRNDTTGVLAYNQKAPTGKKAEIHTIKVPLGGEYELKLSDGTNVFVNSGSTLRYPVFFDGDIRKVELTGEAYFDVTKSGIPFVVTTPNADIHVLGTAFNVSAYANEKVLNTTLVTGSILLKTPTNANGYLISPGQNLSMEKETEQVKIENVNTDMYTAWIHGEYVFRNQSLEDILLKLSKWYDFDIDFDKPEIKKMRFSGSVEKKRALGYFFHQIESVTNLKFKEYGNKVKVGY